MCEALPTKKCSSCGEVKSLSDFPNDSRAKDGKFRKCKQCTAEYGAAQYQKHREDRLKRANEHYALNKESVLAYKKQYYEDNAEALRASKISFYKANAERLVEEKRQWYAENADEVCEARRVVYAENPEKFRELARQYRAEHPDTCKQTCEKYAEENPKKRKVLSKVANAIKRGDLVRMPCEVCGDPNSQGHHKDYDKPLDVMWLCQQHHTDWHRENGEGLNGV